jgi:hypothetical protein
MRYRKTLLAAAAILLSLGSGTAFAYFTSAGTATASASTGTMLTVTVAATAGPPSALLYPGGTGDVALQVTNPNNYAVTLVSVVATGGTITASNGCSPTGVSFTSQPSLSIPIAASATTQVHLSGAASMSSASANACQGATFSIPVTITVRK